MAYDWLTIVESRRLGDGSVFNDAEIKEWRDFAAAFITGFTLVSDTEYYIRVDGLPFFYELLNADYEVQHLKSFEVLIGEGWLLTGSVSLASYDIQIDFHDKKAVFRRKLSAADVQLFIAVKTAAIVSSLEAIGVDVEHFLSAFPPHRYRRELLD